MLTTHAQLRCKCVECATGKKARVGLRQQRGAVGREKATTTLRAKSGVCLQLLIIAFLQKWDTLCLLVASLSLTPRRQRVQGHWKESWRWTKAAKRCSERKGRYYRLCSTQSYLQSCSRYT